MFKPILQQDIHFYNIKKHKLKNSNYDIYIFKSTCFQKNKGT